eukprot:tig00001284_g8007.t1
MAAPLSPPSSPLNVPPELVPPVPGILDRWKVLGANLRGLDKRPFHREGLLRPWTPEDVDKFIAEDKLHGPQVQAIRDSQMLIGGAGVGFGGFVYAYGAYASRKPLLALLPGAAAFCVGLLVGDSISRVTLLRGVDRALADRAFQQWWKAEYDRRTAGK